MASRQGITLVTGASGTVGRQLIAELARSAPRVRALSRAPETQRSPVEWVRFDYRDRSTFEAALAGVERLFVLSPTGEVDSAGLTADFLEIALGRVRRVVLVTAQGVEASDTIPHRRLELRLERCGVDHVVLRPSWFADNFHTFWRPHIVDRGEIRLPAAQSRTAFIDARDIAACAAAALTRDDVALRTYTLTGPTALSYDEAAAVLSRASGRTIRYVDVPEDVFLRDFIGQGMSSNYASMVVDLLAGVRAGVTAEVTDDVRILTGNPARTLDDYARAHAKHWQRA